MYTFRNTERNNNKASDFETKSLLYLIGQRTDKKHISLVAIDCFNDLTGMDNASEKLWDVQSKGEANLTPYKLGKYLHTLYGNFDSKFPFYEYIFFMPILKTIYLKSGINNIYKTENFETKYQKRVKEGLLCEVDRLKLSANPKKINEFLSKVVFVEDRKKKSTYVKRVLPFKGSSSKDNIFYETIFDEIRGIQTAKKNTFIEGKIISTPSEVIKFNRHMRKGDIHMLIVNRFVGVDLFNQNTMMPVSFFNEAKELEKEDLSDLIQDCKSNISRAFFNKNAKNEFWKIFEHIIACLNKDYSMSIMDIYNNTDKNILSKMSFLNDKSVLFLIALIKDGLIHDN